MRARRRRQPRRRLTFNVTAWEALAQGMGLETDADRARFLGVEPSSYHRVTRGEVRPSDVFVAQVLGALRDTNHRFEDLFGVDEDGESLAVAA